MEKQTRRRLLAGVSGGIALLAGCVGNDSSGGNAPRSAPGDRETSTETPSSGSGTPGGDGTATETATEGGLSPPKANEGGDEQTSLSVQEATVPLSYDLTDLKLDAVNGGVPKDGIPSIDNPSHGSVSDGDGILDPGDPVFGVVRDGQARAYPQHILVYHEIVNDTIAGEGVAVTYCPLTGTAMGFERGDVEFGVSGMLVNSNLIMYDRETDSWYPQMAGLGVKGPLKGWALSEFRVTWTTWERWKTVHPDTQVLTEDTGHARNYSRDPYGSYNPKRSYYKDDTTLFSPRFESDEYHPKRIFIGARSRDGTVAFLKDSLRETPLLETTVGDVPYLAAYHPGLDSAWVYRNPDDKSFTATDGGYEGPDGSVHAPDQLPLESVTAFDTFWFPWYGFFPETGIVE